MSHFASAVTTMHRSSRETPTDQYELLELLRSLSEGQANEIFNEYQKKVTLLWRQRLALKTRIYLEEMSRLEEVESRNSLLMSSNGQLRVQLTKAAKRIEQLSAAAAEDEERGRLEINVLQSRVTVLAREKADLKLASLD